MRRGSSGGFSGGVGGVGSSGCCACCCLSHAHVASFFSLSSLFFLFSSFILSLSKAAPHAAQSYAGYSCHGFWKNFDFSRCSRAKRWRPMLSFGRAERAGYWDLNPRFHQSSIAGSRTDLTNRSHRSHQIGLDVRRPGLPAEYCGAVSPPPSSPPPTDLSISCLSSCLAGLPLDPRVAREGIVPL